MLHKITTIQIVQIKNTKTHTQCACAYTNMANTCYVYMHTHTHAHTHTHKHTHVHTQHIHSTLSLLCPTLANTSYFTLPVASTCNGTTSVDDPCNMYSAYTHLYTKWSTIHYLTSRRLPHIQWVLWYWHFRKCSTITKILNKVNQTFILHTRVTHAHTHTHFCMLQ